MTDIKTLKHHAALVDRMADTVGVDMQDAVLDGRLPFDAIAEAVLQCTGCSDPNHCAAWLDNTPSSDRTPGYCRNADLLLGLKQETAS